MQDTRQHRFNTTAGAAPQCHARIHTVTWVAVRLPGEIHHSSCASTMRPMTRVPVTAYPGLNLTSSPYRWQHPAASNYLMHRGHPNHAPSTSANGSQANRSLVHAYRLTNRAPRRAQRRAPPTTKVLDIWPSHGSPGWSRRRNPGCMPSSYESAAGAQHSSVMSRHPLFAEPAYRSCECHGGRFVGLPPPTLGLDRMVPRQPRVPPSAPPVATPLRPCQG